MLLQAAIAYEQDEAWRARTCELSVGGFRVEVQMARSILDQRLPHFSTVHLAIAVSMGSKRPGG